MKKNKAWEDWGSGPRCAWCHKYKKDIWFPNFHIRVHDFGERLWRKIFWEKYEEE